MSDPVHMNLRGQLDEGQFKRDGTGKSEDVICNFNAQNQMIQMIWVFDVHLHHYTRSQNTSGESDF
jgi:hypothetical protein